MEYLKVFIKILNPWRSFKDRFLNKKGEKLPLTYIPLLILKQVLLNFLAQV